MQPWQLDVVREKSEEKGDFNSNTLKQYGFGFSSYRIFFTILQIFRSMYLNISANSVHVISLEILFLYVFERTFPIQLIY